MKGDLTIIPNWQSWQSVDVRQSQPPLLSQTLIVEPKRVERGLPFRTYNNRWKNKMHGMWAIDPMRRLNIGYTQCVLGTQGPIQSRMPVNSKYCGCLFIHRDQKPLSLLIVQSEGLPRWSSNVKRGNHDALFTAMKQRSSSFSTLRRNLHIPHTI